MLLDDRGARATDERSLHEFAVAMGQLRRLSG
jgi:hypothetical protein